MKGRDGVSFSMKNSADLDFSIHIEKNQTKSTTSKEKIRQIFDNISLNIISFLEKHPGITDVSFMHREPITIAEINEWEKKYSPYKLPNDYKSFLFITNGFTLKWHMKYNSEILSLGNISISSLQSLKPITKSKDSETTAFNLNSLNNHYDGTIALIYNKLTFSSSIWFQDISCEWNYISSSFTNYLRLMIMHLGIINWQYSFTSIGLNPITRQWLRFLVPSRLDINLKNNINGYGWILSTKNNNNQQQLLKKKKNKRKKLNLSKIDKIVNSKLLNKDKNKIKLNISTNKTRPGSAPNTNNLKQYKM